MRISKDLNELISLTTSMKITIKRADKGSIFTIMSPEFYWNMRKKHLSVTVYYEKVMCNARMILQEKVEDFIRKYKDVLTDKEYEYLKSYNYRFANFYMLPKLHKSQRLNRIIAQSLLKCVKISKILD